MALDLAFLNARIAQIDLRITAYEAAMLEFLNNGAAQEYTYDTGQTTIRVERQNATTMQKVLDGLMNQRQILCQRAELASGTLNVRGAW